MEIWQWQKVESILDRALDVSNYEEREEYIKNIIENRKVQKEALKWLRAIREANEVNFMEERF